MTSSWKKWSFIFQSTLAQLYTAHKPSLNYNNHFDNSIQQKLKILITAAFSLRHCHDCSKCAQEAHYCFCSR